jgi:Domain of unknown function (DUF5667)
MSRREDFARLVDGDPDARDSAGLGDIATALRELSRSVALPEPRAEFRSDLRQQLVAIATVQDLAPTRVAGRRTPQTPARAASRGRRGLAALAGGMAVVAAVAGVSVAASRSLPGNPFYDVKRAAESVQLFTARGQLDKAHRHLEFAATRLHEARSLSPTSAHLPSTLDAMDSQTRVGATDLIAVARSTHSAAPLTQLRTFTHSQYAGLQALIATSPPALRQREISSANLLAGLDQQAAQLSAAVRGAVIGPESGPGSGGLGGLLQGGLPAPGSVVGSPPAQPGPGTGLLPPRPKGSHPAVPVPTTSGLPLPVPSLPIKVPTTLPTILPPLPTTLPSILPTLPTTVPTVLPPLPSTLPTLLPSVLPTIKL